MTDQGELRDFDVLGDPDPSAAKHRYGVNARIKVSMQADASAPSNYHIQADVEPEFKARESS